MSLDSRASKRGGGGAAPLNAALAKLEVALGATRDAIAWTDSGGRIEWCNAAFDQLVAKSHAQVLGTAILDALPLERWSGRKPHPAKKVLATRSFVNETIPVIRDGRQAYLEFSGSWAEGCGSVPIAVFIVRDVTARVLREEQLRRATAILEGLQEAALDGVLIVDEAGRILKHNRRFAEMWGIPEDILASGRDDLALASVLERLADPSSFLERLRRLYAAREEISHEEILFKDGRVFDRYSAPIFGAEKRYYGRSFFFRDVTDKRKAERELEAKTRELARSNAELQQFASAATHDLMEPLRKIAAFGDLLRARAGPRLDDKARQLLDRMQSAAARMGSLIEDLLRFSRVYGDTRPYEVVDLGVIAREVLGDLERAVHAAGARVEIGPLPTIRAHPFQMRQLFQNLLANAIKFRKPDAAPRVSVRSLPPAGGLARFEVADQGIGFDARFAERIFEPFLRLHARSEYEGTGLGLAICRRIVSRHGGTISAESTPGGGARFVVSLPGGKP